MSITSLVVGVIIVGVFIALTFWISKKLPKPEEMTPEEKEIWSRVMSEDQFRSLSGF